LRMLLGRYWLRRTDIPSATCGIEYFVEKDVYAMPLSRAISLMSKRREVHEKLAPCFGIFVDRRPNRGL